MIFSEKDKKL